MPNHVYNELTVTGPLEDLERFIKVAHGMNHGEATALNYSSFIPYPEKYIKMDKVAKEMKEDLAKQSEKERAFFHKIHGYPKDGYNQGGYQWCIDTWGTKWNAYDVNLKVDPDSLYYSFTSAWSPPNPVILAMASAFPTLDFDMHYEEEDSYAGDFKCSEGVVIEDTTYDKPPSEDDEDYEEEEAPSEVSNNP